MHSLLTLGQGRREQLRGCFIYRPELYDLKGQEGEGQEGIAEIIVGKQRNGPVGSVHMMWNAECASFENLAPEFRMEQEEQY